ncbi:MAG: hypothetical protein E7034_08140 [Akkermansiaceae bacterium]|nr:hypothetical protein [Akkermansiaceae bacterium]
MELPLGFFHSQISATGTTTAFTTLKQRADIFPTESKKHIRCQQRHEKTHLRGSKHDLYEQTGALPFFIRRCQSEIHQ